MRLSIDDIKKLQQKKYRQQFGYFLAEGEHLALELEKVAAQRPALRESELYVTELYQDWPTLLRKNVITNKQMTQISATKSPQGIIALVPLAAMSTQVRELHRERQQSLYLYEIQDPGNLGTILRTLSWFGGFRCLLSPDSVDPFNPKVVRASMGAIFHVALELDVAIESLKNRFVRIAALDIKGESLTSSAFKGMDCYVFGNEARGVPRDYLQMLAAKSFAIPGSGTIESLNLAAAVNMCVYEIKR